MSIISIVQEHIVLRGRGLERKVGGVVLWHGFSFTKTGSNTTPRLNNIKSLLGIVLRVNHTLMFMSPNNHIHKTLNEILWQIRRARSHRTTINTLSLKIAETPREKGGRGRTDFDVQRVN